MSSHKQSMSLKECRFENCVCGNTTFLGYPNALYCAEARKAAKAIQTQKSRSLQIQMRKQEILAKKVLVKKKQTEDRDQEQRLINLAVDQRHALQLTSRRIEPTSPEFIQLLSQYGHRDVRRKAVAEAAAFQIQSERY